MSDVVSTIIQGLAICVPIALGLIPLKQYRSAKVWFGLSAAVAAVEIAIFVAGLTWKPWLQGSTTVGSTVLVSIFYIWSWRWVDQRQLELEPPTDSVLEPEPDTQEVLPMTIPPQEPPMSPTVLQLLTDMFRGKGQPKVWLDVDPKAVTALYKTHTEMQAEVLAQPYVGKWIRVTGKIDSVGPTGFNDQFRISFEHAILSPEPTYMLYFDPEWKDRLFLKQRGDAITVEGKISRVFWTGFNLDLCELVKDSGWPSKLPEIPESPSS